MEVVIIKLVSRISLDVTSKVSKNWLSYSGNTWSRRSTKRRLQSPQESTRARR